MTYESGGLIPAGMTPIGHLRPAPEPVLDAEGFDVVKAMAEMPFDPHLSLRTSMGLLKAMDRRTPQEKRRARVRQEALRRLANIRYQAELEQWRMLREGQPRAVQAVLDLHKPSVYRECGSPDHDREMGNPWPCETVEAIWKTKEGA